MTAPVEIRPDTSTLLPLKQYDLIIVSFSGGKDSLAALLAVLDAGAPRDRVELWHQAVDGRPGVDPRFFDWPCTESYCRAIAAALGLPIRFQWREGGYEREINKVGKPTAPSAFELEEGGLETGKIGKAGGTGDPATRLKFPAAVADLRTRWCSALLKIDVAASALSNDPRFKAGGKVCIVTGERRQESNNRARYATIERHRCTTLKRRVDQWRAVLEWSEAQVWDVIKRWKIRPHPAYFLGWGRVSCFPCIFGTASQWASVREIDPEQFARILAYERKFKHTIQQAGDIEFLADKGQSFVAAAPGMVELAMSEHYPAELAILDDDEKWEFPPGAFSKKGSGGPL